MLCIFHTSEEKSKANLETILSTIEETSYIVHTDLNKQDVEICRKLMLIDKCLDTLACSYNRLT